MIFLFKNHILLRYMNEEEIKNYLNKLLKNSLQLIKENQNLEAKKNFEEILIYKPNHAHILNLLGITLVKLKKYDEAIERFKLAIKNDKNQEGFYVNLGNVFEKIKKSKHALSVYQKGLSIKNNSTILFNQIGLLFFNQNDYHKAKEYFKKSLNIDPQNKFTINNMGLVDFELSDFKSALNRFNKCLKLDKKFSTAHFNSALVYLLEGDLRKGWKEYEYRSYKKKYPKITLTKNEWNGSDLNNKTLLVICEQGIGDNVQFIRFISLIKKNNTKIILFVQKKFKSFFKNLNMVDKIVDEEKDILSFDNYIFLMSLPNIFINLKNMPGPLNFFEKKTNLNKKWKSTFKSYEKEKIKIGLVWQGDHINHKYDSKRSLPLSLLEPILRIEKVKCFSLQKNYGNEQIEKNKFGNLITNFKDKNDEEPFEDTLCIIKNLDLVITVDTALAHISATLGKKTWIMLSKVPDFRWGLEKTSTDWYQDVRIYRQKQIDEWDFVISTIVKDLITFER